MLGISELLVLLHEEQRNPRAKITNTDEYHKCTTCDTEFHGRYCPRCGMDATETRFSIKSMWKQFIAAFGVDDRSITRTVRDLFWRPGQMIGDYLGGRRRLYFPPIKLFLIVIILSTMVVWLLQQLGCTVDVHFLEDSFGYLLRTGEEGMWSDVNEQQATIVNVVQSVFDWGKAHVAYSMMLQNAFWIMALWLALKMFSKKFVRNYNLAEVFMAEMYVMSQIQLAIIVYMCLQALFCPTGVVDASLPYLVVVLLRFYDYWRLYCRGVWGTLWRMTLAAIIMIVMIVLILSAFIFLVMSFE